MTKVKGLAESVTPVATAPSESSESVHVSKTSNQATREILERFMKEESRLVKGRFRCFETPGSTTRIQHKKYPTTPEMLKRGGTFGVDMFDKTMTDGEVYEIPLYAARWLNGVDVTAKELDGKIGSCSYVTHGFKWSPGQPMPTSAQGNGPDGQGGIPVPIIGVGKRTRRYGFESLEFGELSA